MGCAFNSSAQAPQTSDVKNIGGREGDVGRKSSANGRGERATAKARIQTADCAQPCSAGPDHSIRDRLKAVATVAACWCTVPSMHYTHAWYSKNAGGHAPGGVAVGAGMDAGGGRTSSA